MVNAKGMATAIRAWTTGPQGVRHTSVIIPAITHTILLSYSNNIRSSNLPLHTWAAKAASLPIK